MSGVILAVVEHPASALQTLATARGLADLMGSARINVLVTRAAPESTIMPTEEILTWRQQTNLPDREQARVTALRKAFDAWAATMRPSTIAAEWIDVEGPADTLVGEWGRRADFLVLSRPSPHDSAADQLEMQAALYDTDRPVLVVPPGPVSPFGDCVAIAWRDDKRTIRSVLAALRLLSQAREVHMLAGVHAGAPVPGLPDILTEHGIAATLHVLPVGPRVGPEARPGTGAGAFGETLLAKAHAIGADLLVMGAYTHSPWHELLLGGVTRYMLAHADLPVLMRH
ncbi:MAG: universal stress protein [Rhodopila sp.]|nr:universal stress protein [Rhodopila sp.]